MASSHHEHGQLVLSCELSSRQLQTVSLYWRRALLLCASNFIRSHLAIDVCPSVCLSNVSVVTKWKHLAKKSSIMTNRKSLASFPMSRRWTVYVAPNPQFGYCANSDLPDGATLRTCGRTHTTITCLTNTCFPTVCLSHWQSVPKRFNIEMPFACLLSAVADQLVLSAVWTHLRTRQDSFDTTFRDWTELCRNFQSQILLTCCQFSSPREHGQDKTVLSCPCSRCELVIRKQHKPKHKHFDNDDSSSSSSSSSIFTLVYICLFGVQGIPLKIPMINEKYLDLYSLHKVWFNRSFSQHPVVISFLYSARG